MKSLGQILPGSIQICILIMAAGSLQAQPEHAGQERWRTNNHPKLI
jgi:hypothetical protein